MSITIENFFVKSTGVFTEVDALPEGLELNFKSKSSTYYVNPDKTHLWRISDHWGTRIRECAWFIAGYEHCSSFQWGKRYGRGMKIGTIAFADLKPNTTPRKKKKKRTTPSDERRKDRRDVLREKPTVTVAPTPTMQPCVFSKGGFCRTQLIPPFKGQCGVRENSFAHEVCNRMAKENREAQIMKRHKADQRRLERLELKPSFMTTEEDDYNSRK